MDEERRIEAELAVLGRLLKARRIEVGWSRNDLARSAGVGFKTVGEVERGGTPSFTAIHKIATALDADLPRMLGRAQAEVRDAG